MEGFNIIGKDHAAFISIVGQIFLALCPPGTWRHSTLLAPCGWVVDIPGANQPEVPGSAIMTGF